MNELNIYQIFKDIIAQSKMMQRFIVAPQYGNELNKDNLGEILKDLLEGITDGVKYPLCIMFPPVELIDNYEKGWSKFKVKMYFLTTPFTERNITQEINFGNNLSQHTIQETWKDMRLCAINFRKAFQFITERNLSSIRDGQEMDVIERVSGVANDTLAGVGLSFTISMIIDCELEDYEESDLKNLIINTENIHPHNEH